MIRRSRDDIDLIEEERKDARESAIHGNVAAVDFGTYSMALFLAQEVALCNADRVSDEEFRKRVSDKLVDFLMTFRKF